MVWVMKKLRRIWIHPDKTEKWYDIFEDYDLIEASFAKQYGIRLRSEPDMSWSEFCTLLSGIMPNTPLGQIVNIRSENDKEILKNFTKEQRKIRSDWRSRNTLKVNTSNYEEAMNMFKNMFKFLAE